MTPNIAERVEEIQDSVDMGWFCDNPNGDDVKEEIQFLIDLVGKYQKLVERADIIHARHNSTKFYMDWAFNKKESGLFPVEESKEK